jgi:hypothetical protein
MLRLLYIFLLRLHPARFRQRFGDEMLGIFDRERTHSVSLVVDATLSVARQWTLRSEFWEEQLQSVPVSSNVPSFFTFGDSRPTTLALIHGTFVAILIIAAVVLAISYQHNPIVILPQIILPDSARSTVHPPVSPTPLTVYKDSQASSSSLSDNIRLQVVAPKPIPIESLASVVLGKGKHKRSPQAQVSLSSDVPGTMSLPPASPAAVSSDSTPSPAHYEGAYISDSGQLLLTVGEQSGRLWVKFKGQPLRALLAASESRFLMEGTDGQWLEFGTDTNDRMKVDAFVRGQHFIAHRR